MDLGGGVKFLKDLLFPIFCVSCKEEGVWWCDKCSREYLKKQKLILKCPVCNLPEALGEPCKRCRAVSFLDGEAAFLSYKDTGVVGRLIKYFKYGFAEEIGEIWDEVIRRGIGDYLSLSEDVDDISYTLIPIPLHRRRKNERGFNQSEIIAWSISRFSGYPINLVGLVRIKYTTQQVRLSREERENNIFNAFVWKFSDPPPAKILLIDDVFTSGATMQEAARILKLNGAKVVKGLTLARGEWVV